MNLKARGFTEFMRLTLYCYIWWRERGIYESMPGCKKEKSLKNKYSSFFNNRRDIPELESEPESSVERIYPFLSESFEYSLKETATILRKMDANMLQQMNDDRDRTEQKSREIEGSLGLALQAIQRLEARAQVYETSTKKEKPRKAPIILMEDNLTKSRGS